MGYQKNFIAACDSIIEEYTRPQMGDFVTIPKDIVKDPWFKSQPSYIQKKIQSFLDSDLRLVVYTLNKIVNDRLDTKGHSTTHNLIDVAQEIAPGRYIEYVSIPDNLIELVDIYPGLPPIPDSWKHYSKIDLKPVLVDDSKNGSAEGDQTRKTDKGKKKNERSETTLKKESIEINEAVKIDRMYVNKRIRDYNSSTIDFDQLTDGILIDLGIKEDDDTRDKLQDHLSASIINGDIRTHYDEIVDALWPESDSD